MSAALRAALALVWVASLAACARMPVYSAASPPVSDKAGAASSPAAGVRLPDYRRVTLDNGAVLLLLEKHDVPLIGFNAAIRGGALADAQGKEGTAELLGALLEKGAGQRDARAFAEAVAAVGGALSANAGLESVTISGEFLAKDQELMVELLADMLARPALDADEFDKLRTRSIDLIRAARDADPRALIGTYGSAFLFSGHPYGRPVSGSERTLAAIGIDDIRRYYREQIGADRLVVSVAGDFDAADMERRLRAALGSLPTAAAKAARIAPPLRVAGTRVLLVDKADATQSYFWLGNVGVARDFERRAELDLANTVFGGRFTSMLNTELRIKSGLSYGARSQIVSPTLPGSLAIVSFTRTDTTGEAIDLALATLARLHADGLDAEAMASAKSYVVGQFPLGFETAGQLAGQMLSLEFYRLERDRIDDYVGQVLNASAATVSETIAGVFPDTTDLVFVVIGAADQIRAELAAYGPITEVSITEPSFAF